LRKFNERGRRRLIYIKPAKRYYKPEDNSREVDVFKFRKIDRRIQKIKIEIRNKTYRIRSR